MPKVWNKRDPNCPKDAVYVGRPSKWGNPVSIKEIQRLRPTLTEEEARGEAIICYGRYLGENTELRKQLPELRGKDLVCWCAPKHCHADILVVMANA